MIVEFNQDFIAKKIEQYLVGKYRKMGGQKRELLDNLEVYMKLKHSKEKIRLI